MSQANVLLGLSNPGCAVLMILLAIPLVHCKVKRNRWYGIRIKKAFESDENWYQINAYGGRRLILWALVLAVVGIVAFSVPLEGLALRLVLACAPLIVIVPCIEVVIFAKKL